MRLQNTKKYFSIVNAEYFSVFTIIIFCTVNTINVKAGTDLTFTVLKAGYEDILWMNLFSM